MDFDLPDISYLRDHPELGRAAGAVLLLRDRLGEAPIHQERFRVLYSEAHALLADMEDYSITIVRDAIVHDAVSEIEGVCASACEHIQRLRRLDRMITLSQDDEIKTIEKLEVTLKGAAQTLAEAIDREQKIRTRDKRHKHESRRRDNLLRSEELQQRLRTREQDELDDIYNLISMGNSGAARSEYAEARSTQSPKHEQAAMEPEKALSELWKRTGTLPPSTDLTSDVRIIGDGPFDCGTTTDICLGNWLGEQVSLRAIKDIEFTNERERERLLREVEIWTGLEHLHVLSVYGTCYFSPFVYLVSPLSVNGNALKYLKLNPDGDRLRLLAGAASGLAYLHTHNPRVIHGNVRAANIQVMEGGEACISDFGLTHLEEVDEMTTAGDEEGTELCRWMAPELIMGNTLTRTPATDVWSFGMAAFEIFTGRWPYDHSNTGTEVIQDIYKKFRHPRPRGSAENLGLSDKVWDMMCQCWHQDAVGRPEMSEVASFFEGLAIRAGSLSHIGEQSERPASVYSLNQPFGSEPLHSTSQFNPPPPLPTVNAGQPGNRSSDNQSLKKDYVWPQDDLLQELALIGNTKTSSTKYIADLILAIGRAVPNSIRNKHRLYRLTIRCCDLYNCLHRLVHAEGDSRTGFDSLERCWNIMDGLERTLLELSNIVSEEATPFGASSLTTWKDSSIRLSRLYVTLTAPLFPLYNTNILEHATWDRYFDDCSWSSLLLLDGVEAPIQRSYPEGESTLTELRSIIKALNYLVDEMKLNSDIDEHSRDFFMTMISDTASVMMNGPKNASPDFWNAAASALRVIDLEKRLDQETVDLLHQSWSRFALSHIRRGSAPSSPTLSTSRDPITISLPEELTHIDHEVTPATQPLILLLQALGKEAPKATRNKHNIYAIVVRARDICNHILAIGTRSEFNGLSDLDEYYNKIDALEGVLLDIARLLPAEQVIFGPELCASWSENRKDLIELLDKLHKPPLNFDLPSSEQEHSNNTAFDDCYWLSLLLHEGIERELGRLYRNAALPPDVASVKKAFCYLENEIRCSYSDDATRELHRQNGRKLK